MSPLGLCPKFKNSISKRLGIRLAQPVAVTSQHIHSARHFRPHFCIKAIQKFLRWTNAATCFIKDYLYARHAFATLAIGFIL